MKILKAHLVRSASTSAAVAAGIITNDILKAVDWTMFQKFNYQQESRISWSLVHCCAKISLTHSTRGSSCWSFYRAFVRTKHLRSFECVPTTGKE